MPDQFEQYYKYLKANGADVAPDFNSFKNTLSNYDNASKYYSYLKDNDFDVPASYDSFADTFGLKKKDGGIVSSPIPSKLPSKGVLEQGLEMATKGFAVNPQEQSTFSKVEQSLGKVKKAYDAIQFLQNAPPEFGGVSKEDEKLANQNYANAEKEKQNLLKTYSKDIYSNVDELLANNGYKNLFEGDVFNTEKARSILDEKVIDPVPVVAGCFTLRFVVSPAFKLVIFKNVVVFATNCKSKKLPVDIFNDAVFELIDSVVTVPLAEPVKFKPLAIDT
jgi:hypothetical protein